MLAHIVAWCKQLIKVWAETKIFDGDGINLRQARNARLLDLLMRLQDSALAGQPTVQERLSTLEGEDQEQDKKLRGLEKVQQNKLRWLQDQGI